MNRMWTRYLMTGIIAIKLLSCANPATDDKYIQEFFATITERDLIPEGTAYDPISEQLFLSSMYKRKIVAIRKDGTYYDFVKEGQDSIWATLGMEVDPVRHTLWVISAKGSQGILTRIPTGSDSWEARLYCYDIPSGVLNRIYQTTAAISGDFCFNDLTVNSDGDVYLTESFSNRIFHLPAGGDSINVFLEPAGYTFLNGITLSSDEKTLFVASTENLLRINLETKQINAFSYDPAINPRPIDGLAFFNRSLIGHQSDLIQRFYLNETMDSILSHEVIDSSGLDSSTTGELGAENWYYYIGNSQIRSGIDYKRMEIKPLDSLENVIIKRVRLKTP